MRPDEPPKPKVIEEKVEPVEPVHRPIQPVAAAPEEPEIEIMYSSPPPPRRPTVRLSETQSPFSNPKARDASHQLLADVRATFRADETVLTREEVLQRLRVKHGVRALAFNGVEMTPEILVEAIGVQAIWKSETCRGLFLEDIERAMETAEWNRYVSPLEIVYHSGTPR